MPRNPANPRSRTKKLSPTLVTFLLDRSSSMGRIKDSTIEAFNGYLDGLRKQDNILFSLVQFDHYNAAMQLEKVCVNAPVVAAPDLNSRNFEPRGSTPLIQAAITVIDAVETSMVGKPLDTKVVVCIQTDGEENCSTSEYTWERLAALIKTKQDKGWQFNFMGAGIDAYQQGARMGLSAANTMSYDSSDRVATRASFVASAVNTSSFAAGKSANTQYSAQQKLASGDKYDPAANFGITAKTMVFKGQPPVTNFVLDPTAPPKAKEDFKL